jgi:hypothetical protein
VNIKTRIRFNGQDYDNVEAMPPAARAAYEQALARGLAASSGSGRVTTTSKLIINGREYAGPDELPPELRAQYDRLMGQLDADHNGIPDMLEKGAPTAEVSLGTDDASRWMESLASQNSQAPQAGATAQSPANFPVISAEPPRSRRWIVLGITLVILLTGVILLALLLFSQTLAH